MIEQIIDGIWKDIEVLEIVAGHRAIMVIDDYIESDIKSRWRLIIRKAIAESQKHESEFKTCICMDCGKTIKVMDQSSHLKECPRSDCQQSSQAMLEETAVMDR